MSNEGPADARTLSRHCRASSAPRYPAKDPASVSVSPLLRIRWDRVGRSVLLVVLLAVAGLYIQQAVSLLSVRSQANRQQAQATQLRQENASLSAQQQSLQNPATLEQDARALGMVRPGERPYVVTGLSGH